jgi:hypothetical protein
VLNILWALIIFYAAPFGLQVFRQLFGRYNKRTAAKSLTMDTMERWEQQTRE